MNYISSTEDGNGCKHVVTFAEEEEEEEEEEEDDDDDDEMKPPGQSFVVS